MTNSLMLGTTLLSFYWLFAASFYVRNSPAGAALFLFLGLVMLKRAAARSPVEVPKPAGSMVALLLAALVVAIVAFPMPYRVGPALAFAGLVGWLLYGERHARTRPWCYALAFGGFVLIVQSLVVPIYLRVFAADHQIPWLRSILWVLLRAFGHDAAIGDQNVWVPIMRDLHGFPVTSERLGLFVLSMILVGFVVVVFSSSATRRSAARVIIKGLLAAAIYAMIRYAIVVSIYLHLMHRMGYFDELNRVDIFWSPWWTAFTFIPLAWLFAALSPKGKRFDWLEFVFAKAPGDCKQARTAVISALLAALTIMASVALTEPSTRKPGRVVVDEFHSDWEPTERPYDTNWYGHGSGYNYAAIYDYLSRYYKMARLQEPIGPGTLDDCDVLMVKIPTKRYEPNEIERIVSFVRRGGGVFLIGEHTNVFGSGEFINPVAEQFGCTFRYDCLFDTRRRKTATSPEPFEQFWTPPRVLPHPVVENVPMFLFQVSASIKPRNRFLGEPVIIGTRLKSLMIDYHADNFYPQVVDRSDMDFGPFLEMWARYYGKGRVLAFADSTCYSNFCAFQPGKPELILSGIEWLSHRNRWGYWKALWAILGLVALVLGVVSVAGCENRIRAATIVAFILAGTVPLFALTARGINRSMPGLPAPREPLLRVCFERGHGDYELPIEGFVRDHRRSFDLFYQWVMRLGVFPHVGETLDACLESADAIVLIQPKKTFTDAQIESLRAFVRAGGGLLLLDNPLQPRGVSDSLLRAFDMSIDRTGQPYRGIVQTAGGPAFSVDTARPIDGGEPIAWDSAGRALASSKSFGKGRVVAATFAQRFCDQKMGGGWQVQPTPEMIQVYEMQYALLRAALAGKTSASVPVVPIESAPDQPTTATRAVDQPTTIPSGVGQPSTGSLAVDIPTTAPAPVDRVTTATRQVDRSTSR